MTNHKSAYDTGFCVYDSNATAIAETLIHRVRADLCDTEGRLNRVFKGRQSFDLSGFSKAELSDIAARADYLAQTAREVLAAQTQPEVIPFQEAAE